MLPEEIYFGDLIIPVKLKSRTGWTSNLTSCSDNYSEINIEPSLSREAQCSGLFLRIMDFVYWHTCNEFSGEKKYTVSTLLYSVLRDNPGLLDRFECPDVKTVRICGRNFTVIHRPGTDPWKGSVYSASLEMHFRETETARDYRQTVLHEIVHNVLNVADWPDDDQGNEPETDRLSRALMFIIGQNDMSWMKEKEDGE